MQMNSTSELDKNVITEFFIKRWGSPQMVISSGNVKSFPWTA